MNITIMALASTLALSAGAALAAEPADIASDQAPSRVIMARQTGRSDTTFVRAAPAPATVRATEGTILPLTGNGMVALFAPADGHGG